MHNQNSAAEIVAVYNSDKLSILSHSTCMMAKTWQSGGGLKPYDNAKYFSHKEVEVSGLKELSDLLFKIEPDPHSCFIRGFYKGDDAACALDPEYKPGKIRRLLDNFADQPQHTALMEVDEFKPTTANPIDDPVACIEEYIRTKLPPEFHGVSYHWQLSSSAGYPGKEHLLKVHIWFWLETPYTSEQLKFWATAKKIECDKAVFNPVQVHYTARPVFEVGVKDPVQNRSGLQLGSKDAVPLIIDFTEDVPPELLKAKSTRLAVRSLAIQNDSIAVKLNEMGLVKSEGSDGRLNIECPFVEGHSTTSNDTSTIYFPAFTGGFSHGAFKCLHGSCMGRKQHEFLEKIGIGANSLVLTSGMVIPKTNNLVTHYANFLRLVKHYGGSIMFSAGKWHVWNGKYWCPDEAKIYAHICNLSNIIQDEVKELKVEDEKAKAAIAKALKDWAKKSEMKAAIDAVLQLARKLLIQSENTLNQNPWFLNCKNGTVDLRTGELRPHNPLDFITKIIDVDYKPDAVSEAFNQVVYQIACENPALVSFLQRWFGYCATGSTREQKFAIHHGTGSNGKSTLLDTVATVLGEYANTAAPGLIINSGKNGHPTEIADLFGRRMITSHESGDGSFIKEDFIKHATGSDKLKGRYMRQDFFEYSPTHKLQLVTNYKPNIKGQDHGIWRRILTIPYSARFGSEQEVIAGQAQYLKDVGLPEKLNADKEAILNWIVQGAVAWCQGGLNAPDIVVIASKDYQSEQDRIAQFVKEECELGEYETPLYGYDGLYEYYCTWCKNSGFRPVNKNRITVEFERIIPGFEKVTRKLPVNGTSRRKDVLFIRGVRHFGSDDVGSVGSKKADFTSIAKSADSNSKESIAKSVSPNPTDPTLLLQ